jgi:hypothetical protein
MQVNPRELQYLHERISGFNFGLPEELTGFFYFLTFLEGVGVGGFCVAVFLAELFALFAYGSG